MMVAGCTRGAKVCAVCQRDECRAMAFRITLENGKKVEPAHMTVTWNGVKVHDNTKVTTDNTTAGLGGDPAKSGPLMLQDHGSPVQYRNIWVAPLETPAGEGKKAGK